MIEPNQLEAILEHISEAIILLDANGIITQINPRVDSLLGISSRRLHHQPLHDLVLIPELNLSERLGFETDSLQMLLHQLTSGMHPRIHEEGVGYHLLSPYRRFIRRTDVLIQSGSQYGLLMIFTDETDTYDLHQTQEQIASMIVHDLRSPLTAVTASMRLLRDIANPDDAFGQTVLQTTEISGRAVRKLLHMVDSLLDVSRMESGVYTLDREPTDLRSIVQDVVDELSTLASEMDVELVVSLADNLPLLDVDPEKVERIFYNLVDNAIKFTPGEGTVTLMIDPTLQTQAGFLRIDVRDTGSGIPKDMRERLFDRYQQGDMEQVRRRGTGLGLTFCKLTVEEHGGFIWIEDNPEGGSVFAFTLPIADT